MNKCEGCSKCCEWDGILTLTEEDVVKLSAFLKVTVLQFEQNYTREYFGERILNSKPTGECVFLHEKLCLVYDARPLACVQFPRNDQISDSMKTYCKIVQLGH